MKKTQTILQLFAGEVDAAAEGTGVTPAIPGPEANQDPGMEFENLIRGKYKEQYDAKVQDTVRKRLRSSHETVEKYTALTPALNLLSEHYGIAPGDAAALARCVESDDTFYQRQSEEQGMDVQSLRAFRSLQQENAALRQSARQVHAAQQVHSWKKQADEAKNTYPELDMNVECRNPRFRQLLYSGLDVGSAYLVLHRDELMQSAAENARKMVVNNIVATGSRPSENGTAGQSAAMHRADVASMSRSDREAIRRRAARGERIRF